MSRIAQVLALAAVMFFVPMRPAHPADAVALTDLLIEADALERESVELAREVFQYEEGLLFPDNNRLVVFLSMQFGAPFVLHQVRLLLNGKVVKERDYTLRDLGKLQSDAAEHLLITTLAPGRYTLDAELVGEDLSGYSYTQGTRLQFVKGTRTRFIDLVILGDRIRRIRASTWE